MKNTKEKLEIHNLSRKQSRKDKLFFTTLYVALACVMVSLGLYYWGNQFVQVTKKCTVTQSYLAKGSTSAGGTPLDISEFIVESDNCPTIRFSPNKTPDGFATYQQVEDTLVPGHTYKFQVGFFRLTWGATHGYWRGIGIDATPVD